MRLLIDTDASAFAPGDAVTGRVRAPEGGSCRELSVSLVFREASLDYRANAREVPGAVLHRGDLLDGAEFAFSLALPPDALPGVSSPHGALVWVVEAKVAKAGPDHTERQAIDVQVRRAAQTRS